MGNNATQKLGEKDKEKVNEGSKKETVEKGSLVRRYEEKLAHLGRKQSIKV